MLTSSMTKRKFRCAVFTHSKMRNQRIQNQVFMVEVKLIMLEPYLMMFQLDEQIYNDRGYFSNYFCSH